MKVLLFTDVHRNRKYEEEIIEKAKKVDFIINAGDFFDFGNVDWWFIEELNSLGKKIFFVDGTHEDLKVVKKIDEEFENWVWVHNKIIKYGDYFISGFGDMEFKEFDPDLHELIKKLRDLENIIFISHVPPYGTAVDIIWNEHRGNPQLTQVIYLVKPKLYVCGHFHENFGISERIMETLLVNPGPEGMVLEL